MSDDDFIENFIRHAYADDPEGAQAFRDSCRYWALDENEELVGFDDVVQWAHYKSENPERDRIAQDTIVGPDGKRYFVSTVMLGLDYGMIPGGPLILFETMVFEWYDEPKWVEVMGQHRLEDRDEANYLRRYPTIAAARAGHDQAIAAVLNGNLDDD